MDSPKVSIIIPVYNVEQYINECIDSILAQTFTDFELLLVDDCSPGNSPKICDEYAKQDMRIKVIHKSQNEGASLARKTGLEKSSGDYVLFIDSDDWIEKDMLNALYGKAVSEDCDMVVCDCFYCEENQKKILRQKFYGFDTVAVIKNIFSFKIRAFLVNKLVKRELYLRAKFPVYSRSEDYVISIQNVCNSKKIGYVGTPFYNYRYNMQSLSNNTETAVQGRIDENRNWRTLLIFLKEKYGNLKIFEPELSNRLNSFRDMYMQNSELKKISELNELFEIYKAKNFWCWKAVKPVKSGIKKLLSDRVLEKMKNINVTDKNKMAGQHEAKI